MNVNGSFGSWLRQRRKALDLTRTELAGQVGCAVITIQKIETDERRPSKQVAERMADVLAISLEERTAFVAFARRAGVRSPAPSVPVQNIPFYNLPPQITSFVGRVDDVAHIAETLGNADCRLVTLVGPGGIGKTSLALQVAHEQSANFVDGAYFVALAPIRSADLLAVAIGSALNLSFYGHEIPAIQLLNYLRNKAILVVLDNFEHLLDDTDLLIELLMGAPRLKLLVTSRERLNVQEEWIVQVSGLDFPLAEAGGDVGPAEEYSAVQLFVQSARRRQANFTLTSDKAGVLRICQLVEGMPLGIVLAATWVDVLTPSEIAREIQTSFGFLATSLRNIPERHRSMQAVFEWSWHLLSEEERRVFQRLSVFRGGFRREAAQQTTNASLRTLAALVNKSLVRKTRSGRYEIHELLRQFAEEYLEKSGEADLAHDAHSVYFTDFLAEREADLKGHRQLEALAEIEADFENVRSAWNWAVKRKNYTAVNRSLESLDLFCATRSHWHDREAFFRQAQEELDPMPGREPHPVWGRILGRGERTEPREHEALRAQRERALGIAQQYGNQTEIAYCLWSLGEGVEQAGDYAGALPFLERSLAYFHEVGDRYYIAKVLNELSTCYWALGKLDESIKLSQQSLDLRRAIGGQRGIGWSLYNLGIVSSDAGLYADGVRYLNEARTLWGEIDDAFAIAHSSAGLALLAFLSGDFERARTFAGYVNSCHRQPRTDKCAGAHHAGQYRQSRGSLYTRQATLRTEPAVSFLSHDAPCRVGAVYCSLWPGGAPDSHSSPARAPELQPRSSQSGLANQMLTACRYHPDCTWQPAGCR